MHNHTEAVYCLVDCPEYDCPSPDDCLGVNKYLPAEKRDGVEIWQASDGPAPIVKVYRENGPVVLLTGIHPDTIEVNKDNLLVAEMANDRDTLVHVPNVLYYTIGEKA